MNHFSLKKFFDKNKDQDIKKLYEVIKFSNYEKIISNNGNITFLKPSKGQLNKIIHIYENHKIKPTEKIKNELRQKLSKLFVKGKHYTSNSWKSTHHVGNKEKKVKRGGNDNEIIIDDEVFIKENEIDDVPIWGSKERKKKRKKPKRGGAFLKDSEFTGTSLISKESFEEIYTNHGLKKIVALLYDGSDKADCIINNHPLAEFFILANSPFFLPIKDFDPFDEPKISYEEILQKKGIYLANCQDEQLIAKFDAIMTENNPFEQNALTVHEQISNGEKISITTDIDISIIHPDLAPYFQRLSLFVAMINEIEKQMHEAPTMNEKFELFCQADNLNKTTNMQTELAELDTNKDISDLLAEHKAMWHITRHMLIKSKKTLLKSAAKEKKKGKIKLLPNARKALFSSIHKDK